MAPVRAFWKGYLKLSLVSCPIALYTGTSATERVSFRQINEKTGNALAVQNGPQCRPPVPGHLGRTSTRPAHVPPRPTSPPCLTVDSPSHPLLTKPLDFRY